MITSSAVSQDGEPFIDPEEIDDRFKGLAMVLDGGGAGGMDATTVVDLTSGEIEVIREGAGPLDELFG